MWLFLDDLHWADTATLAWLNYLLRHFHSPKLTVLAASRPVEGQANLSKLLQALNRDERLAEVKLAMLPAAVMEKMAARLSPSQAGPLSAWLIENAEGNPFFVTEMVRYAYGIGLLNPDGALNMKLFGSAPAIPATIQNLIEARLLRLSEAGRKFIHLAAIIGREFDLTLILQSSRLGESGLLDALEELEAAHLIQPMGEERYSFDHTLTMQVALQDMSQIRRNSLHRRVAETLESLRRENLDASAGLISRHYLEASLPAQAAHYAFRAGQYAANLPAWAEAIAFYEEAFRLETDPGKRGRISLAAGAARFHKGDFTEASQDYRQAANLAREQHDWSLMEAAHLALNQSFLPQARFTEAIDLAKELRRSGPPELLICAEFCWGTGLGVESAHPVEAEQHLREAERLLLEQSKRTTMVTLPQIHYQLAGVVGQLGRSEEAIGLYRGVLDMLDQGKASLDILRNIMLYNNLAYHLHLTGDPSAAKYIQAGIKLAREKGSLTHLTYLYSTSGEIAMDEGRLDEAEKYFREGLEIARQIPMPERIAGMTANLGLVAARRGLKQEGLSQLNEALDEARRVGTYHLQVRIAIWMAPLLPPAEAESGLEAAARIAKKEGLQSLLEEIRELRNGIHAAQERPARGKNPQV